jgi:hypothetical protein
MKSKAIFFGAMLVSAVILSHPALATTVDLTAEVNANLSSYTNGTVYPANGGPITIGGVGFNLNAFPNGGCQFDDPICYSGRTVWRHNAAPMSGRIGSLWASLSCT